MRERYEAAVDEIIADLKDRKGLGDEWYAIDDNVMDEIREEWIQILERSMNQWLS